MRVRDEDVGDRQAKQGDYLYDFRLLATRTKHDFSKSCGHCLHMLAGIGWRKMDDLAQQIIDCEKKKTCISELSRTKILGLYLRRVLFFRGGDRLVPIVLSRYNCHEVTILVHDLRATAAEIIRTTDGGYRII